MQGTGKNISSSFCLLTTQPSTPPQACLPIRYSLGIIHHLLLPQTRMYQWLWNLVVIVSNFRRNFWSSEHCWGSGMPTEWISQWKSHEINCGTEDTCNQSYRGKLDPQWTGPWIMVKQIDADQDGDQRAGHPHQPDPSSSPEGHDSRRTTDLGTPIIHPH